MHMCERAACLCACSHVGAAISDELGHFNQFDFQQYSTIDSEQQVANVHLQVCVCVCACYPFNPAPINPNQHDKELLLAFE